MNANHREGCMKKICCRARIKNEQGSVLVLSTLMAALFVTFSTGYLNLLTVEAKNTDKTHRSNVALHLAESGVEEAIWEIKYNGGTFASGDGWSGSNPAVKTASLTTPSGENLGSYTVTVTDPSGTTPVIESVGSALYQTSTFAESRIVKVTLDVEASEAYTRAAFAEDSIEMDSNACTDSFDSRDGPYDLNTNRSTDGDVGINSIEDDHIELGSNVTVAGDIQVGVGGDPDSVIKTDSHVNISGTQTALSSAETIAPVPAPTGLTNRGSLSYNDNNNHTISLSGQYTNFAIDGNSSVTISGDTTIYVTGAFTMDSNSDLYIASGSTVKIYVGGSILLDSNATINNLTQDPSKLQIYGTDDLVDDGSDPGIRFNSNTDIYATIHAKNSTISLDSNAEIFGAVVADKISLDSNTCIHYDVALGASGSSGSTATVAGWQEK